MRILASSQSPIAVSVLCSSVTKKCHIFRSNSKSYQRNDMKFKTKVQPANVHKPILLWHFCSKNAAASCEKPVKITQNLQKVPLLLGIPSS